MAHPYIHHAMVFTLILLAYRGIVLADENMADTTSGTASHQQDMSYNNNTEPKSSEDNLLYDNSTQSANNNSDTVTENSTAKVDKPTAIVTTATQSKIESTQGPTQNNGTTQKSHDNTESDVQSSTKAVVEIETQSKEPGNDITSHKQDKSHETKAGADFTTPFVPVTFDTRWMDIFFHTHHFEGQYLFKDVRYLFDFVVRYKHPDNPRTLVANLYDADGAVLEFNGTSSDGHMIVLTLSKIYTPGVRFPLHQQLEISGSFTLSDQPYFTGNFTKPVNSSFSWFHMNKGLGTIETGETAGTKTAIVIIIPTSIAFLGICGTVAIICWASKKGYLRGRHKSYRLFTDAQVSYESEAETIHI